MFKKLFSTYQLFRQAFWDYKLAIAFLFALSFFNSFFEGVGISAIIPAFAFVNTDNQGTDFISTTIRSFFGYFNWTYSLSSLLLFIGSLFVLKVATLFAVNYVVAFVRTSYQKKIRTELFQRTIAANWHYLSNQKVGHLDQLLTTNIDNSSALLSAIATSMLITAKLIVYGLIAVNISLPITLLALAISLGAFFIFRPLFYRNKKITAELESINRQLAHSVNENIIGMKTIKSLFSADAISGQKNFLFDRIRKLSLDVVFVRGATDMLMQLVGLGFIFAVFVFFYKNTVFNFASFAVMIFAINQVFSQAQLGQAQLHNIISLLPYLAVVMDYRREAERHKERSGGRDNFIFNQRISFEKVVFAYDNQRGVLKDVSFSIDKGQMVGLIGPSGSGKTTIVDLLLRLYDPQNGAIMIDRKNIADIDLMEWRKNVGYVSQDMFLLNDTIENNIRFYNDSISREDVISAAKTANIYGFIEDQPEKFLTVVGERGIRLSNGQRQRIALARVLARKPKILILDEATSALDNESEAFIRKSIEDLRGRITTFIIAHRLSTVKKADKLIVLESGKIVEQGDPEELLKDKNSYFFKANYIKV